MPTIESFTVSVDSTSYEMGTVLLSKYDLEGEIKLADKNTTGSDAWLNNIVNRQKELTAIERFRQHFRAQNSQLPESTLSSLTERYIDAWLVKQLAFSLSENGCNKFLQVQPNYNFTVTIDEHGHSVTPSDITQFGDLADRYIEENSRVGTGLFRLYVTAAQDTSGTMWAGIVSPTEEYEGYNSKTDVINIWRTIQHSKQSTEAEGKYLVLNKALSVQERRFIHNLFYGLKTNKFTIGNLVNATLSELIDQIPTDILKTDTISNLNIPEYQRLIMNPNDFTNHDQSDDALFHFAQQLDQIFKKRFGFSLIDSRDIEMYPIIQELVKEYLPHLKNALLNLSSNNAYYAIYRRMIYHCQALWAKNQKQAPSTAKYHNEAGSDDFIDEHLLFLMNGTIVAGFESNASSDSHDPFNLDKRFDFDQPLGWELKQGHCDVHGEYNGAKCPKCQKEAESKKPVEETKIQRTKKALKNSVILWQRDKKKVKATN